MCKMVLQVTRDRESLLRADSVVSELCFVILFALLLLISILAAEQMCPHGTSVFTTHVLHVATLVFCAK